jgi:hypothetical protein
MTTAQKVIKTKMEPLELGKELGNVSKPRRVMGYGRDSFYRFKERHETGERRHCRRFHEASGSQGTGLPSRMRKQWWS